MSESKPPRNTEDDSTDLWHHLTKEVKVYNTKSKAPIKAPLKSARHALKDKKHLPSAPDVYTKNFIPESKATVLDRATGSKIKKGDMPIDGKIDLHGMTQDRAYTALKSFIVKSAGSGKRTLLVITGKGEKSQGVLKRMLPLWLERPDMKPYLIGTAEAAPKHGGSGAFYIRLKKSK